MRHSLCGHLESAPVFDHPLQGTERTLQVDIAEVKARNGSNIADRDGLAKFARNMHPPASVVHVPAHQALPQTRSTVKAPESKLLGRGQPLAPPHQQGRAASLSARVTANDCGNAGCYMSQVKVGAVLLDNELERVQMPGAPCQFEGRRKAAVIQAQFWLPGPFQNAFVGTDDRSRDLGRELVATKRLQLGARVVAGGGPRKDRELEVGKALACYDPMVSDGPPGFVVRRNVGGNTEPQGGVLQSRLPHQVQGIKASGRTGMRQHVEQGNKIELARQVPTQPPVHHACVHYGRALQRQPVDLHQVHRVRANKARVLHIANQLERIAQAVLAQQC
ncbi:hypothetical protein BC828DRAFT_375409 [Blastocladiella britannica]|nr:hypothetical protein BC828DRAFT_375409 [Blastocladiella britannica]